MYPKEGAKKTVILTATATAIAFAAMPGFARTAAKHSLAAVLADDGIDKRCKPRIKGGSGGSGCDDAGDIGEHAGCR